MRRILDVFDLRLDYGSESDREEFVASITRIITERFGSAIHPNRGESLALSVMAPKTAALAFDRVYRFPGLVDPAPEEIGFYCATLPEMVFCAAGILAVTAEQMGLGTPLQRASGPQAAENERQTLRILCSDLQAELGTAPTVFYHEAANLRAEFPVGARSILQAAISNVALVDEKELTWDQVTEFRRDAGVRAKYRRFVRWVDAELKTHSPQEIEDLIATRLDDYAWALKKHGIKASLGAVSCLLDPKFLGATSAAVAAGAVAGGGLWATLAGASLTVGRALVSFGTALVDGFDERRKENYEVAYIYEIQKRLGAD